MQRENNDGRDKSGRFQNGNSLGFERGKSGNPQGRPRSALLTDAVRKKLTESDDLDKIALSLIAKAKKGDLEAVKIIFDRLEGKAVSRIDADVNVFDWQTAIRDFGISPQDILNEATKLLSESKLDESDFE